MKRNLARYIELGLLLGAAWLLPGCGDGGGGGGGDAPAAVAAETPEDDFTRADLEYKPGVAVLDDVSAVQAALLRADYTAGELVFASDFEGLASLTLGEAAVIGGVGVFRIIATESVADGELVRVEAAPLTAVLQNADIAWRRSFVSTYTASGVGLGIAADETENVQKLQQPLGSYEDGKLSFEGSLGPFATTFNLEPGENGLDFAFSAKATTGFSEGDLTAYGVDAIANASLSGTLRTFTNNVELKIVEGEVVGYDASFQTSGSVAVKAGMVELAGDTTIKIPARLALPVWIGPIPFHVELGSSLEMSSTLRASCTTMVEGHTEFSANAAVILRGTDVSYQGNIESSDLVFEKASHVAVLDSGMSMLLNFPELSVGVGVPNALDASAHLRFRTEVISNISLKLEAAGPYPVITGNCVESHTSFGASYGGALTFLGFEIPIIKETQIFGKVGAVSRSGTACDE